MKLKLAVLFLFVVITIALSNTAFAAPHDEVVFPDVNLKKALLDEGIDRNNRIFVNGVEFTDGVPQNVAITYGENFIPIVVRNTRGEEKTYTLKITRELQQVENPETGYFSP